MEISVRVADNVVVQFGQSLGERDGCSIETMDDDLLDQLHQPGIKTIQADGTLIVTPPDPNAPDPVKDAQEAQMQAAQALIATSSNQQQADAMTAFMRTLGLPL